jgi:hypothetical protein
MLQGASEMALAFEIRPLPGWVGVLISSLCSIGIDSHRRDLAGCVPGPAGNHAWHQLCEHRAGFMTAARAVKQLR